MTNVFVAVFEDGVLKPIIPLDLPEGVHVNLYLVQPNAPEHLDSPGDLIAAIAKLPEEDGPTFSACEQDQILYGKSA